MSTNLNHEPDPHLDAFACIHCDRVRWAGTEHTLERCPARVARFIRALENRLVAMQALALLRASELHALRASVRAFVLAEEADEAFAELVDLALGPLCIHGAHESDACDEGAREAMVDQLALSDHDSYLADEGVRP